MFLARSCVPNIVNTKSIRRIFFTKLTALMHFGTVASKGTLDDAKCVTEILGGQGSWGTNFKFGQLILRKIIKIMATRCHILRLKCTKFDFVWGSAPDPYGELRALPRPLARFKGSYF